MSSFRGSLQRVPGTIRKVPKGTVCFVGKDGGLSVTLEEDFPLPMSLEELKEFISIFKESLVGPALGKSLEPLGPAYKKLGLYVSEVSEQEVEIDGEPAIQLTYLICRSHPRPPDKILRKEMDIIAIKDSTLWAISCMARPADYDRVNKTYFEPMIQSFKFE